MIRRSVLLALVLIGCANASALDDAQKKDDAPINVPHADASHTTDGPPPIDAPMNDANPPADAALPPDANTGAFCTDNTTCGAGTCCYFFVCTPGLAAGKNLCFPS